jgi:hypothetical protein
MFDFNLPLRTKPQKKFGGKVALCPGFYGRYIGGLGPCSLYLIFSSDLVEIYLVDPYTIGKISASSISWYKKILMLVTFMESY